jgi:voltage-gated potassium channel
MRKTWRIALDAIRTVWKVAVVVVILYFALSIGFYWAETTQPCVYSLNEGQTCHNLSLGDGLWWGIVTLSTVGYGDIVPHTVLGRTMGAGLMVFQIGFLGYLLSVILGAVTDVRLRALTGSLGTEMKEHVVVCGFSLVGRSAVRELLASNQKVAVVCEEQSDIQLARQMAKEDALFVCHGSVNNEETLQRANAAEAHAIIFATEDDTTNLIGALLVRSLWPKVRVVVSVQRPELRRTLKTAGVTYVASPADMGGRLCSSAAFRPEVASAVEDLTTATYGADIQEFRVLPTSPIANLTLRDAESKIRSSTDCIVVGIIRPIPGATAADGPEYESVINPPPSAKFDPGTLVLIIGGLDNLAKFEKWYGIPQGR